MEEPNSFNLADIWQKALSYLEKNLTAQIYDTWIKSTIPLKIDATSIELGVAKNFVKEWLENRYLSTFEAALKFATDKDFTITFTNLDLDEKNNSPKSNTDPDYLQILDDVTAIPTENEKNITYETNLFSDSPHKKEVYDTSYPLNPKYTFATFVPGNSNRLAHAASRSVAERPAKAYNPFFIYGNSGLGKTHLMHAIGNNIRETFPQMKVVYISSETFTNEFINSIRNNSIENFRQRYRFVDVLLIDDIQFIEKKESTQEEFFHTFNILHGNNKQIIISSDRNPREIETLESRLRSRFNSGLIADISPPDLETRIAILRQKAMIQKINMPSEVIVYIASRIENNVRELEGAFIRIVAFASLYERSINIDLATEALQDIFPQGGVRQVTIEHIKEIVSNYFKIKLEDLSAKNRTRNIAYPRQIAMYLCCEFTSASLPKIGDAFGGRDHTTVIHSRDKIEREKNADATLNKTLKEIIKKIEI